MTFFVTTHKCRRPSSTHTHFFSSPPLLDVSLHQRNDSGIATVWAASAIIVLVGITALVMVLAGAQISRHQWESITDHVALSVARNLTQHNNNEKTLCHTAAIALTHTAATESARTGFSAALPSLPSGRIVDCRIIIHPDTGLPAVLITSQRPYLYGKITVHSAAGLIYPSLVPVTTPS